LGKRERRGVWAAVSEIAVPYVLSFFCRRLPELRRYDIRVKSTGMRLAMRLKVTGECRLPVVDSVLLRRLGLYEPNTSIVLREEIAPGDTVIELGAAYGYFSVQMSRYCGPLGRVYAFEPSKESFEILRQNIQINGCQNVEARNEGLGRERNVLVDGYGARFETKSLLEFMESLDRNVDFVFIDVDARNSERREAVRQERGLVGDVLEYGMRTGRKPKLFIEYPGQASDMEEIRKELGGANYEVFRVTSRHWLFK